MASDGQPAVCDMVKEVRSSMRASGRCQRRVREPSARVSLGVLCTRPLFPPSPVNPVQDRVRNLVRSPV